MCVCRTVRALRERTRFCRITVKEGRCNALYTNPIMLACKTRERESLYHFLPLTSSIVTKRAIFSYVMNMSAAVRTV